MSRCTRIKFAIFLYTIGCLIFHGVAAAGTVIFVDAGASGVNDGSSWADAYTDLQDALTAAQSGDEIWVVAGVYKPVTPVDLADVTEEEQKTAFRLIDGVSLYGGFSGVEMSRDERNWEENLTVLSGDIDDNDETNAQGIVQDAAGIEGRNSTSVVTGHNLSAATTLDGFVITAGWARFEALPTIDKAGGGIYLVNSNIRLTNLVITGNTSSMGGGGLIHRHGGNALLQNVLFEGNRGGPGAGMRCEQSSAALYQVTFRENHSIQGGGLFSSLNCTHSLEKVKFVNNSGDSGGGAIWIGSGCALNYTEGKVENNLSSGSPISSGHGGGIYIWDAAVSIRAVNFIGNSAEFGGGVYSFHAEIWLSQVEVAGNSASVGGGGLRLISSSARISSSAIAGNVSEGNGGGVYSSGSSPVLRNATLSGNVAAASGGGIHNSGGSLEITNSILWNNAEAGDSSSPGASLASVDSVPHCSSSLIANSGGSNNWNPSICEDGGNNIDTDPLFVDPIDISLNPTVESDLRLLTESPAIDSGDNEAAADIDLDLDGNARIYGPFVDMGAYEYGSVPPGIFMDRFEEISP